MTDDVRSLLRAERLSRRVTHPNASYTTDGKLLCNLCELPVKSEASWQSHLHSTGHSLRLNRAKEAASSRADAGVSDTAATKKRKASSLDSPTRGDDEAKRVKQPAGPVRPEPDQIEEASGDAIEGQQYVVPSVQDAVIEPPNEARPPGASTHTTQDDELAAFEREMAELEASQARRTALNTEATISAAPMTAEQLAAQAREEQNEQKGRRDREVEAEKEDAEKLLEEEFEEMEELEERVRKLRERREALRRGSGVLVSGGTGSGKGQGQLNDNANMDEKDEGEGEEEDEEDDEGFDEWGFGGR